MFLKKTIRRVQKAIGIVRSRSSLDLQKLLGYFGPSSDPGFPQNSGRSKTSVWNIKPHYQLDGSVRRSWGGHFGSYPLASRPVGRPISGRASVRLGRQEQRKSAHVQANIKIIDIVEASKRSPLSILAWFY